MQQHMSLTDQTKSNKSWINLQFHDDDQQHIKKPNELIIDDKDYPPPIKDHHLIDRIQGSMFGMAIGDALGAHVEFRPHSYLVANPVNDLQGGGTWGLEKGQFTDDTSMALCLANSLIARQDFHPYDQLVRYKWWYRNGYMSSTGHCFDIGAATRQSIQVFEMRQRKFAQDHDIPFNQMDSLSDVAILKQFDTNCSKPGVAGNGALMRLAPVPLFFYRSPEKAIEYSGISGQITHGDDKAYDACRYYGALIVAALQGMKKDELLSNTFYDEHKPWFGNKPLDSDIMIIAQGSYKKHGYEEGIRGKGYIVSALEAALWAFYSDGDSFKQGALNAVNLGDDTDTTAAIYGQLAGAYYGYNKLPKNWLDSIYANKFIECVSHWIAYEGEQWSANQNVTKPLINSDPTTLNNTHNTTRIFKQDSYVRDDNQISSIGSIVHNPMNIIERKAIDPSGRIGSFYNGYRDCIVESTHINLNSNNNQWHSPLKCVVERGTNIECQNLLRFIGFDDEFRLSIASNIISPTGIASVIEYPHQIDECTRVLYYSFTTREELSTTDLDNARTIVQMSNKNVATHIITGIDLGIDLIVLLRLPHEQTDIIDDTLNKICQCLTNDTKLSGKISLDGIVSMNIYSNIPHLTKQKTLIDLYHEINQIKKNGDYYQPSNYILHPIEMFYPDDNKNCLTFVSLKRKIAREVEQYFIRLSSVNKMWKTIIDDKIFQILNKELKEKLNEAQNLLSKLNNQCDDEKKRIKNLIIIIRQGKDSKKTIEHQLLTEEIQTTMTRTIDDFKCCLMSLKGKTDFINDLEKKGFNYCNVANYDVKHGDNDNTIQQKLIKYNWERILCSNDTLNESNWQGLQQLLLTMINEHQSNPNLRFVYADFSYSSYELDQMKSFPLNNYRINNRENTNPISPINDSQTITELTSSNDHTINILLLGKSSVGKSTLINTFINYLKFDSYEEFLSSRSPLSILIALGHFIANEYEEHFIRIGNYDPNEDYDHPGQPVTQRCKSYTFNIHNGKKLCIIDTPGFSNTNDQNQNELNMQYILSNIINLTHLNAVCVLLESGDTQLNEYQICLRQLAEFFQFNAGNNILFCFTKSLNYINNREQRNAPLKSMLNLIPMNNIFFNEEKIFVFDSTYFIQSTISRRFTTWFDPQNRQCQLSWQISKDGWKNLLDYVCTRLKPYFIHQGLQKTEYVRLQIKQMIRPMLETMRNIFRNQLLLNTRFYNFAIQLNPKPISNNFAICYSCERGCYPYNIFWIMCDTPHEYRNSCYNCSCNANQHMQIDYRLDYEFSRNRINYHHDEMIAFQKLIFRSTLRFAHFLINTDRTSTNDRFLSHLNRMIDEERYISENISPNSINSELHYQLIKFKQDYQHQIKQKHVQNDFDIDDLIERVKKIPMIKRQMDVARKMHGTLL